MVAMKNWMIALVALAMGGAVSATLLVFANPARAELEVFALARDLPSGSAITLDALRVERVAMSPDDESLIKRGDQNQLDGARASHDLAGGQLLQRTDVLPASTTADERLVFMPIKDAPSATPGAKLDLLVISGTPDHPTIVPFALGVDVRSVVNGGFVVAVTSRQAPAFVYAAEVMRLVAVVAAPGAPAGSEGPVGGPDEALAMAAQP